MVRALDHHFGRLSSKSRRSLYSCSADHHLISTIWPPYTLPLVDRLPTINFLKTITLSTIWPSWTLQWTNNLLGISTLYPPYDLQHFILQMTIDITFADSNHHHKWVCVPLSDSYSLTSHSCLGLVPKMYSKQNQTCIFIIVAESLDGEMKIPDTAALSLLVNLFYRSKDCQYN